MLIQFLARLHFCAEKLLLYPRRQRRSLQNVRTNVKSWNFSLSVFFLTFKFAYHTNKAPYNKSLRQARIRWLWHLWLMYKYSYMFDGFLVGLSFFTLSPANLMTGPWWAIQALWNFFHDIYVNFYTNSAEGLPTGFLLNVTRMGLS